MLVLDALFDHIQQISSNVEIIGILIQRFGSRPVERPSYKFDGIDCRPELGFDLDLAKEGGRRPLPFAPEEHGGT
jgi:hypothetical protein